MKTSKDSLYELVNSLNSSEKRYFKVFASAFRPDSGLLRLFDRMTNSEAPTERDQEKVIGRSNLNAARSDLRKLILRAMRSFHSASTVRARQRNLLADIEFLQSKMLFDDAEKELRKAMKDFDNVMMPMHRFELLLKYNELVSAPQDVEAFNIEYDTRLAKLKSASAYLSQYSELALMGRRWNQFLQFFHLGDNKVQGDYFRTIEPIVMGHIEEAETPLILAMGSGLLAHGRGLMGKTADSDAAAELALHIFNSHQQLKEAMFVSYFGMVYNYASALYIREEDEKSLLILELLRQDQEEAEKKLDEDYPRQIRARHRYSLLSGRLRALCGLHRYQEAIGLLEEHDRLIASGLVTTNTATDNFIQLRFASAEFMTGEFRKARKRTQALITSNGVKKSTRLYANLLLAEALCTFELNDNELFCSQVENLIRTSSDKGSAAVLGEHLPQLLRKMARYDGSDKTRKLILQLCDKMRETGEHKPFNEFTDIERWARSKMGVSV